MLRSLIAALLMSAAALAAQAEPDPGDRALAEAMQSFFVVVAADAATGNPVAEVRRNADGSNPREVVVAFLDAADAAAAMTAGGMAAKAEGRLQNAADLLAASGGEVIWRTSEANASVVNGNRNTPPAFYVANPAGEPLTQFIGGQPKVFFYLDADAADRARVTAEALMAASGQTAKLSVIAGDFLGLMEGVKSGALKDAFFVSSPSVVVWAAQWESGTRLIGDYKAVAN